MNKAWKRAASDKAIGLIREIVDQMEDEFFASLEEEHGVVPEPDDLERSDGRKRSEWVMEIARVAAARTPGGFAPAFFTPAAEMAADALTAAGLEWEPEEPELPDEVGWDEEQRAFWYQPDGYLSRAQMGRFAPLAAEAYNEKRRGAKLDAGLARMVAEEQQKVSDLRRALDESRMEVLRLERELRDTKATMRLVQDMDKKILAAAKQETAEQRRREQDWRTDSRSGEYVEEELEGQRFNRILEASEVLSDSTVRLGSRVERALAILGGKED